MACAPSPVKTSSLKLDVTVEEDWVQAMEVVRQQFGRLDVLVNNAGNSMHIPIEEMTLDTVWYLAHLNIEGAFLGQTYAWPLMQASGGVILDVNSGCWPARGTGRHSLPQFERRPAGLEQGRSGRRTAPWH